MFTLSMRLIGTSLVCGLSCLLLWAGVSKEIQNEYIQNYKNRALFLKVPVHGLRQVIHVGSEPVLDRSGLGQPVAFKVGDQVRITDLDFKDELIRFKLSSIDLSRQSELIFQFPLPQSSDFPSRGGFDKALDYAFTAGLSYKEIDTAKETFISGQFDSLIQQFANTTGTTTDYVIRTISEQNPEVSKMRAEINQKQGEVDQLREALQKETNRRRESESEVERMRREYGDIESRVTNLRAEQQQTVNERDRYQRQARELASQLESKTTSEKNLQKELGQLLSTLDLKSSRNAELDDQVKSLTGAVTLLKTSNSRLEESLGKSAQQLEQANGENRKLSERVNDLERERSKLAADLRVLTSDKKSINAQYIELKEQKEVLETAEDLARSFQLRPAGEDNGFRVMELYLQNARVGTLHVQLPGTADEPSRVILEIDSPDTVKFSEEERRLYGAIGDEFRVEASWETGSDALAVKLAEGEAVQSVGPREKAEWTWAFAGAPSRPTTTALVLTAIDSNGKRIRLPQQQFVVSPSGLGGLLSRAFSLWSLLASFLVGGVLVGIFFWLRKPRAAATQGREVQRFSEKKL